jgi:protein-ribulosamine 3-kinase
MPSTIIQTFVEQKLKERFPSLTKEIRFSSVGGGCINETFRITAGEHEFFCKLNSATKFPHLFEREKNGLDLIAKQNIIRVPAVIDCFESTEQQVLLLEWIREGEKMEAFWKNFGEQLAALHCVSNEYFGLNEDNYMGSVPQFNSATAEWNDFFIHQRLHPLIDKCITRNLLTPKHQLQFESLYEQLDNIFDSDQKPLLLHGDLWGGNLMCNENSEPVLIDPAVYFGHPSCDLGMTILFGSFHSSFYEAYNYYSPFPPNHQQQWEVCNVYPLLIHLYLFGRSYLSQIEQILNRYS